MVMEIGSVTDSITAVHHSMEIHRLHMFQLSHFEREAPVLKYNSRHPVSSSNLPFWDYPGSNIRSLLIFQINF